MTKKILILLFFIFIFIISIYLLTEIKSTKLEHPPDIEILLNNNKINYEIDEIEWNGQTDNKKDVINNILLEDIPTVNIGESLQINFKSDPPRQATLYDGLINLINSEQYEQCPIQGIWDEYNNGDGELNYVIESHIAYSEKNIPNNFKNGNNIRVFRLYCSWGENNCEYVFLLKDNTMEHDKN